MNQATQSVPCVSVIIPTHNRAQLIGQALQSVLEQTYADYEIIVIDDGSTDNTRQVVQSFSGPIHYVYQNNRGASAARNQGIELAHGKYIAFLDSDDWCLPQRLEKQANYLDEHLQTGAVYSWYIEVNEHDNRLYLRRPDLSGAVYKQFLSRYMVGLMYPSTVMVRREVLTHVGVFDEQMPPAEDSDLWCRIARFYDVGLIREPLSNIRRHSENTRVEDILLVLPRIADKAFEADRKLSWFYKRRIYADVYGMSSSYLFFDKAKRMEAIRQLLRGLLYWPFPSQTIRTYAKRLAFTAVNSLPKHLSIPLLHWWRQRRVLAQDTNMAVVASPRTPGPTENHQS